MVLDNGEFWVPEDFQLEFVEDLFSGVPELWLIVPEGNGKALDVATPLATPAGWTTMGAVRVGDYLLGADGEPVRVTFATEVQTDRECFTVRFSDGAEIVADADHLWEVEDAANGYKRAVRSTRQLLTAGVKVERRAGAWCSARWRVRTAARGGEARALTVDPLSTTTGHRRIAAIEAVESRPVRCVQVDADDHLYLAGEALIPTHNTTLLSGVALYHGDYRDTASVLLAASSRDQCGLLLGQAEGFVRRSPGFDKRFRVYEGYRRIDCLRTQGRIQVFASEDRTGDGVIPTLALLDELHRHKSLRLYRTWKGKLDKRGAQLATISTAGEPGGEFEVTRERIRTEASSIATGSNGRHIRAASSEIILHDYGLRPGDDPEDMAVVKDANPFSGVTVESLARKRRSPTMTVGHWLRFVCDVATRTQAAAVGEAEWAAAEAPGPDKGQRCDTVGLDIGWKWDCTALAPWFEVEDGLLLGESVIITPPRDGNSLDPQRIREAFERLHAAHPIGRVAMDMTDATEIAHWLERELGVDVVDVSQKALSKASCAGSFLEGLRARRLWHVHDPEMTRHVMNAVAEDLANGSVRFVRPKSSRTVGDEEQERRVIDGLDAAAMGHFVAASGVAYDGPLFEILT